MLYVNFKKNGDIIKMRTKKLKLKMIKRSHNPDKKYDAIFITPNGTKIVPFGSSAHNDFILYTRKQGIKVGKEHRKRYIQRHSGMGEHWNQPDTPGALSRWMLWGKYPSLRKSMKLFRKKFNV